MELEDKPEERFKPLNDRRFSHNELAEILGVKPGTIRGEATQCRKKGKQYRGYFPDGAKWFQIDPSEAKFGQPWQDGGDYSHSHNSLKS